MSKAEEKRQREQLIRQVRRLTRARVNDAVKLAYLSGEALEAIDGRGTERWRSSSPTGSRPWKS